MLYWVVGVTSVVVLCVVVLATQKPRKNKKVVRDVGDKNGKNKTWKKDSSL